jgi:hypothetical protein
MTLDWGILFAASCILPTNDIVLRIVVFSPACAKQAPTNCLAGWIAGCPLPVTTTREKRVKLVQLKLVQW